MGQYIKRDLTPEEWEEEGRKLAELYRMIDEHFSPDKKEEQETDEKE